MAVCSKCGVTVQDQNLQPDAEGKLVCRTCAGAWRAKSGQMTAGPARQDASPGFWMPLALAASVLCVLLLIIAIAVGAGKKKAIAERDVKITSLQKDKSRLEADLNTTQLDKDRLGTQVFDLQTQLAAKDKELADLKAGKKPPTGTGKTPPTGTGTGTGTGTDTGTGTGVGTGTTPTTDKLYINAKAATVYHLKGCTGLKAGNKVITPEDAKKRKLKPCPLCKPPAL